MAFSAQKDGYSPFLMEIEDVFTMNDRGTVVSGKVQSGDIVINDEVEIIGLTSTIQRAVVVEKDVLYKGNVLLKRLTKDDLIFIRGQVLATPGTMKPYTKFLASVNFFESEAQINPQPFLETFRSSLYIRGTDIYGTMWLPEGTKQLSPGDQMNVQIELQAPVALEIGLSFGIGRKIGRGIVMKLLN